MTIAKSLWFSFNLIIEKLHKLVKIRLIKGVINIGNNPKQKACACQ